MHNGCRLMDGVILKYGVFAERGRLSLLMSQLLGKETLRCAKKINKYVMLMLYQGTNNTLSIP